MSKEPTVTITLTKTELWELINIFEAGFVPGPGNETASKVSNKLHKSYDKVRTK
jgi:hypothetical protein